MTKHKRGRKKGRKGYELTDRILFFLYEMQKEYGEEKLKAENIRELPHEFFGKWLKKILDHNKVKDRLTYLGESGRLQRTENRLWPKNLENENSQIANYLEYKDIELQRKKLERIKKEFIKFKDEDGTEKDESLESVLSSLKKEFGDQNRYLNHSLLIPCIHNEEFVDRNSLLEYLPFKTDIKYICKHDGENITFAEYIKKLEGKNFEDIDIEIPSFIEYEEDGRSERDFQDLFDGVINRKSNYRISGPPGSGKTTLLRHLQKRLFDEYHIHGLIPLYVDLGRLTNLRDIDNEQELENLIRDEIIKDDLKHFTEAYEEILKEKRFVFLFDGLDEVDPSSRRSLIDILNLFYEKTENPFILCHRGIVSPEIFEENDLPLTHLELKPFDRKTVENFVEERFEDDPKKIDDIFDSLVDDELRELVSNPLMLHTMCEVYDEYEEVPDTRTELYQIFLEKLLSENEKRRDGAKKIRSKTKLDILQKIAFYATEERTTSFSIDETDEKMDHKGGYDAEDLVIDCEGILKKDGDKIKFVHKTYQEYLAAEQLRVNVGDREYLCSEEAFNDLEWWMPVASFYSELVKVDDLIKRINHNIKEDIHYTKILSLAKLAADAKDIDKDLLENITNELISKIPELDADILDWKLNQLGVISFKKLIIDLKRQFERKIDDKDFDKKLFESLPDEFWKDKKSEYIPLEVVVSGFEEGVLDDYSDLRRRLYLEGRYYNRGLSRKVEKRILDMIEGSIDSRDKHLDWIPVLSILKKKSPDNKRFEEIGDKLVNLFIDYNEDDILSEDDAGRFLKLILEFFEDDLPEHFESHLANHFPKGIDIQTEFATFRYMSYLGEKERKDEEKNVMEILNDPDINKEKLEEFLKPEHIKNEDDWVVRNSLLHHLASKKDSETYEKLKTIFDNCVDKPGWKSPGEERELLDELNEKGSCKYNLALCSNRCMLYFVLFSHYDDVDEEEQERLIEMAKGVLDDEDIRLQHVAYNFLLNKMSNEGKRQKILDKLLESDIEFDFDRQGKMTGSLKEPYDFSVGLLFTEPYIVQITLTKNDVDHLYNKYPTDSKEINEKLKDIFEKHPREELIDIFIDEDFQTYDDESILWLINEVHREEVSLSEEAIDYLKSKLEHLMKKNSTKTREVIEILLSENQKIEPDTLLKIRKLPIHHHIQDEILDFYSEEDLRSLLELIIEEKDSGYQYEKFVMKILDRMKMKNIEISEKNRKALLNKLLDKTLDSEESSMMPNLLRRLIKESDLDVLHTHFTKTLEVSSKKLLLYRIQDIADHQFVYQKILPELLENWDDEYLDILYEYSDEPEAFDKFVEDVWSSVPSARVTIIDHLAQISSGQNNTAMDLFLEKMESSLNELEKNTKGWAKEVIFKGVESLKYFPTSSKSTIEDINALKMSIFETAISRKDVELCNAVLMSTNNADKFFVDILSKYVETLKKVREDVDFKEYERFSYCQRESIPEFISEKCNSSEILKHIIELCMADIFHPSGQKKDFLTRCFRRIYHQSEENNNRIHKNILEIIEKHLRLRPIYLDLLKRGTRPEIGRVLLTDIGFKEPKYDLGFD